MKIPVIELGECVDCDACIEVCPAVFTRNDAGYIEVIELPEYLEEELEERSNSRLLESLLRFWVVK